MVLGSDAVTGDDKHHTHFVQDWGDGQHQFAMLLGGIRELQIKCKCGINDLYMRICEQHWFIDDLRETIRIGLVEGGGVDTIEALRLVERYVDGRPVYESLQLAVRILSVALIGEEEEELKKNEDESEEASQFPDTILPASTGTVQ